MSTFQQMALQALDIFTLVFAILGITFSLLLLFSPNLARTVSNLFNRSINFEKRIAFLDKELHADAFFYRHNIIFGLFLILGSAFSLVSFFFKLEMSSFASIFFVPEDYYSAHQILFEVVVWLGKIVCFFGLLFGLLLVIAPKKMRKIETRMNAKIETKGMFEKLDSPRSSLDMVAFRMPIIFGLSCLVVSFLLLMLSINNLLLL
jgi:hypothetical protein